MPRSSRTKSPERKGGRTQSKSKGRSSEGSSRGRSRKSKGSEGKLTGLWESKNNSTLFVGNMREESQIEELRDLCDQVLEGSGQMVFFLYENEKRRGKNDPDFNIYAREGKEWDGNKGIEDDDEEDPDDDF